MHIKEKYDRIIHTIEELVEESLLSSREIGLEASRVTGIQIRDLSAIFSFLLDITLNNYILGRKMDKAYILLVQDRNKMDIQSAIDISGYADQPSFTKAFKRRYSMTPREAHKKQDMSIVGEPVFWDKLSQDITTPDPFKMIENEDVEKEMIFGVSEQEFSMISKAMELESFYGLPRIFSSYAFDLVKRSGQSMEACFKYSDSLREYFDETVGSKNVSYDEVAEIGNDQYYQSVFFARGITVSVASELRYDYNATLDDLMKCDMDILKMFPGFEKAFSMSFSYYVRAFERYVERFEIENDDPIFYDYISLVMVGMPIEEAFDEIYATAAVEEDIRSSAIMDYDDFDIDLPEEINIMERDLSIEEIASGGSNWVGERIDDDLYYDPDNLGYTDEDLEDF